MTLIANLSDYLIKIHIVHSLPGRLRLAIPALKEIPKTWQVDSLAVTELIQAIPGVKAAAYNYLSGSVLITYDAARLNEKQIMTYLKKMVRIVAAHRSRLAQTKAEELDETVSKMREIIKFEMSL